MVWYAFGDRAPSAKRPNDLDLYELALDMHVLPNVLRQLRKRNPRDYYKLILVNEGRKLGERQIAVANKLPGYLNIKL